MIKLNLKPILDEKGLTITDLHKLTGISRSSLTPIINKPDEVKSIKFEVLDKICESLNIELKEFITHKSDAKFEVVDVKDLKSHYDAPISIDKNFFLCKFKFTSIGPKFQSYLLIEEDFRTLYDEETTENLKVSGFMPVTHPTITLSIPSYFKLKELKPNLDKNDKQNLDYITEYISKRGSEVMENISVNILEYLISENIINGTDYLSFQFLKNFGMDWGAYLAEVSSIDYESNTFDFNVIK